MVIEVSHLSKYYQVHQKEFGQLPTDEQERQVAWRKIDAAIRETLAGQVQAEYEQELDQYLQRLKANAVLTFASPLAAN